MFSHSLVIAWVFLCCFSKDLPGNEPEVTINAIPVSCNGGSNGQIRLIIVDSIQIFSAQLFKYSPTGKSISGEKENDTTCFIASDLSAGKYFIEIKGDKGFSFTKSIEVLQPDKLESGKIFIEKKLSALDAGDAILKAVPLGGVPPYTYSWDIEGESKNSPEIQNIGQGSYSCVINDNNNCGPVKTTILFNQYVIPDIVEE